MHTTDHFILKARFQESRSQGMNTDVPANAVHIGYYLL